MAEPGSSGKANTPTLVAVLQSDKKVRQFYVFLALEVSNLFVTLPSKNKLPEDIFFNQFNVNGALRARKHPFFF